MTDDFKVQLCNDDFYQMLERACQQAGGGQVDKIKTMYVHDMVEMLARNGIRMVYMADKHMDAIRLEWKAKTPPSGKRQDGPIPRGEKKLLLDSTQTYYAPMGYKDNGEDDEELNK